MRAALMVLVLGAFVAACGSAGAGLGPIGGSVEKAAIRAQAPATLTIVAPALNNPALPNAPKTAAANFTVAVSAVPGAAPITVRVYGPPGAVTLPRGAPVPVPSATVGAGGKATFRYTGAYFANAMTVTAVAGTASATAQIFGLHSPAPSLCRRYGNTSSSSLTEKHALTKGFFIHTSIAGSTPLGMQLDTGSTGILIAKSLIVGAQRRALIGPGQAGEETLEPSNITEKGNYYLAPVSLSDAKGRAIGTTVPMEVLVLTQKCDNNTGSCKPDTNTSYMGIGFGRPTPKPGTGYLRSPLENAFLQLSGIVQANMHPGFILSESGLQIGLNAGNAHGFKFTRLAPFPNRQGDWTGPTACLQFNGSLNYCGHMLLDIGIDSMFIAAPTPSPLNTIAIFAPNRARPYLAYSFAYPVTAGATPPAPDPNKSPPIVFEKPGTTAFVNTGRDALAAAGYLYDSACGFVGFGP